MTTTTDTRIAEIRQRAERAAALPWRSPAGAYENGVYGIDECDGSKQLIAEVYGHSHAQKIANADFIANCPSDIPYLLAEVERLKGERVEFGVSLKVDFLRLLRHHHAPLTGAPADAIDRVTLSLVDINIGQKLSAFEAQWKGTGNE